MKKEFIACVLLLLTIGTSNAKTSQTKNSNLIVYPAIPGLTTSDLFSVRVNDKEIWTEKFITNMDTSKLPDWFKETLYHSTPGDSPGKLFMQRGNADFNPGSRAIKKVSIHPLSRNIKYNVEGNALTFSIPGPANIYIEINDLPPLCIFASPVENENISRDDPNVYYFGPAFTGRGI